MPDEQGLRIGLTNAKQKWQQNLTTLLITSVPDPDLPSISIESFSLGKGYLSLNVVKQLINNQFVSIKENEADRLIEIEKAVIEHAVAHHRDSAKQSKIEKKNLEIPITLDNNDIIFQINPIAAHLEYASNTLLHLLVG